jgi:membrane associated rhomboid family serine protease
MLIIPVAQKPTWRSLPLATLLLLFINVFVFLFLQLADEKVESRFQEAYVQSKLAETEFPQYKRWLEERGSERSQQIAPYLLKRESNQDIASIALGLQMDREFMAKLEQRQQKTLSAEQFSKWREARLPVDAIWHKNFTERYLFVPAEAAPVTYITHMFMHGGIGHLLGNMVMLVLIGMLIEQAVGMWPTVMFYLLGGLGSVFFEMPFHGNAWVGSLGASGAIAALMGASAMLYGMRKVRFFYHVVFYFDFIVLPAIVVLPVWIINEIWQWMLLHKVSNVAYFAHVGGLIVGALLAFAFKRANATKQAMRLPPLDKRNDDPQASRERRAHHYLTQMNWDAALREFLALAEAEPKNIGYAEQVYKLSRMKPATDDFHRAALALLSLTGNTVEHAPLQARTIIDYWTLAKPAPQLSASSMAKLSKTLAKNGYNDAAELPANTLVKLPSSRSGEINLAEVLLTMVAALRRAAKVTNSAADMARSQHYFNILETRFPHSTELALARQLMAD